MISRKKPKKEEFDEDDSEQQQAHHPPSAKKVKFSTSLMNEDDEYSLWLVRKPIKVSLSDLSELKFPTITERRTEVLNGLKSECAQLKCEFEPTQTQMLYVPMDTAKDSKDCKAVGELCGTVFISQESQNPQQEDGDCEDGAEMRATFEIQSIRKKPKLRVEGLRERLKAFGLIPRSKRDKLPNLLHKT